MEAWSVQKGLRCKSKRRCVYNASRYNMRDLLHRSKITPAAILTLRRHTTSDGKRLAVHGINVALPIQGCAYASPDQNVEKNPDTAPRVPQSRSAAIAA